MDRVWTAAIFTTVVQQCFPTSWGDCLRSVQFLHVPTMGRVQLETSVAKLSKSLRGQLLDECGPRKKRLFTTT